MKYRFKPTQRFWESFYALSPSQKESTRRAWKIFQENPLQLRDRRPLETDVRITPKTETRNLRAIFVADIQSAGKTNPSIDNQELAMVAHIDLDPATKRI